MPDRPLFLFPTPEPAGKASLPSGFQRTHKPSHRRQGERVAPILSRLQEAIDTRHIEIQQTAAGVEPEQVLVIEIIGNIENFANAVKLIDGFEWMWEIEIEEIAPDDDFYIEKKPEKELHGRLFMVMTNQEALRQMLSLWNRYKIDENMSFDRGYARFRNVFLQLHDIRRWDVQDRLSETGVLDFWVEDMEHFPDQPVRVEIELWFRNSENKRKDAERQVTSLIGDIGGRVQSKYVLPEIAYHSILAELPMQVAQHVIKNSDVELIKCDSIMFFRPVGPASDG